MLAWGLLGLDRWRMHKQHVEHAGEQAASLARAVEQRVSRTLRVTDQTLKLVREEILSRQTWRNPQALGRLMMSLAPHLEEVLTVSFIAPDGISLAQSNPAIPVGRHYADSDFFRYHAANADDQLYIEKPLIGPASGRRIFTLSRPLRGKKGELLGIISASVRVDVIAAEFAEIRIGNNGSIGFHHLPSYLVLARQPDHEMTFGRSLEHRGLQEALTHSPTGSFEGEISPDGVRRIFAYRKLEGLPLAVTAGVARSDLSENLRDELAGYLTLIVALTLAIAGGTAFILRAHRREIRLRQDIAEKDALFRAFFEAVPAGMCTLDREMRYRLVNRSLAWINGKELSGYAGRTVHEVHPRLLNKLAPIHHDIFATGREHRDVEFQGQIPGQPGITGYWQASFFPIFGADQQVEAVGCFIVDVTAQKIAKAALQHNEALLSTVLDVMPVGVMVTDPQGRIVRNNPAAEHIWMSTHALPPENHGEYKGWWADSGVPLAPEDWALSRAICKGESSLGEVIEIECFDGSRKTILNSAAPLHDPEGKLLGAIAVNEDITAMKKVQEEIRISRDFFEQSFNAAPVGMAIADYAGRYIKVNPAMTQFLGYSEGELLSMTYMDITHPDDRTSNHDLRKRMLAGDSNLIRMEKRYIRKDGRIVWAIMVASSILGKNGKVLYTIGQMLDIDRQKIAEQSLRESEARFRAIFENANTGIAAIDDNGAVCYFNEAFRSMLGYDAETLKQKNFAEFTHPEDLAQEYRLLDEIRSGKRENYRLEKRYLRADGSLLWIDLSAATIRDAAGRILNFIAVVRDINENKQAELALNQSRQKLRALSAHQTKVLEEDRKHIAREIHDELGQLLTALKMDVSLLRINFGDNPKLQEKSEQMRKLVDKTMDVVRQVATNLRPAALDLGLIPAIEWLAEDFSSRWEIPCTVDVGDEEITLSEPLSTTVFRVVQESLTNIARHANASKVSIALTRDHRMLNLFVRDDGRGFDRVATGQKKGFGFFGMRERVLAVGGKLSVDSAPGKGTTVSITLPIRSEISQ